MTDKMKPRMNVDLWSGEFGDGSWKEIYDVETNKVKDPPNDKTDDDDDKLQDVPAE